MKMQCRQLAVIAGVLLANALFIQPGQAADDMFSTGGYARQLHKIEMMKMLDADGNHMVTLEEFNNYYSAVFDALNKDKDDTLDAKEWVGDKNEAAISFTTGGYNRELRKMAVMSKIDQDGDHKVSKTEFLQYHQALFKGMDKSGDQQLDPQEWLAKQTGN